VLEQAAALATLEGLKGISIARLANATAMPKSSVYVLFGSKEQLQLATIDTARASFITRVVAPAITTTPPGRHGCFDSAMGTSTTSSNASSPVAASSSPHRRSWAPGTGRCMIASPSINGSRKLLTQTTHEAQAAGEPPAESDPEQLASELGAILAGTNIAAVLHQDNTAIDRARPAIRARIIA
jgi:AcrR family transcriptional regulator